MSQKTAVIYARVSSKGQKDAGNIEAQLPICLQLVEQHELRLLTAVGERGLVTDDGVTGRLLDKRTGMSALLEDIDSGKVRVDFLVCADFERLFREDTDTRSSLLTPKRKAIIQQSMADAARVQAVLLTNGVQVLDVKYGKVDFRDPIKRAITGMQASLDGQGISDKTYRGKRKRLFEEGLFIYGRPPYGYKRKYVDEAHPRRGAKLIVDPVAQAALVRILSWFSEGGAHWAATQATLARIPVPTAPCEGTNGKTSNGKTWHGPRWSATKWTHNQVLYLVRRADSYVTGRFTYRLRGETKELQFPTLIEESLWQRVQEAGKQRQMAPGKARWTSGFLACRACGKPVLYRPVAQGKYPYWECDTKGCGRVLVTKVEDDLWTATMVRLAQVLSVKGLGDDADLIARQIKEHQSMVDDVDQEIGVLLELRVSGEIDPAIWQRKNSDKHATKTRLSAELAALRADLARVEASEMEHRTLRERIADLIDEAHQGDVDARRRIVAQVTEGKRIKLDKSGVTFPDTRGLPELSFSWGEPGIQAMYELSRLPIHHGFVVSEKARHAAPPPAPTKPRRGRKSHG